MISSTIIPENSLQIELLIFQDYVDSNRSNSLEQMRDYVAQMLLDVKNAHKAREEQLSHAAQGFKKRMSDVAKQHEALLVAYT